MGLLKPRAGLNETEVPLASGAVRGKGAEPPVIIGIIYVIAVRIADIGKPAGQIMAELSVNGRRAVRTRDEAGRAATAVIVARDLAVDVGDGDELAHCVISLIGPVIQAVLHGHQ